MSKTGKGEAMRKIEERYREALGAIPAPGGGGCHAALLGVANLGIIPMLAGSLANISAERCKCSGGGAVAR